MSTQNYNTKILPTWCPGCGNFGILSAIKHSLKKQNLSPDGVLIVSDIGCSGNMADFINTYRIHALHGRAISVGVGAYLAHHNFPIIISGGDGGIYGEGVEHLIKACQANYNITAIVHNNNLYSLTSGQRSPTSERGKKTKSTPQGVIEIPFEPLQTAIIHDAGFVARGFAGDIPYLSELITAAIQHPGFALIDVFQSCPTLNLDRPFAWYKERIYRLKTFKGFSKTLALSKIEDQQKIVTGVLYRSTRPAFHTLLPQLQEKSLLNQSIKQINIADLLKTFC